MTVRQTDRQAAQPFKVKDMISELLFMIIGEGRKDVITSIGVIQGALETLYYSN